jgi:hypothetical protein
MTDSEIYQKFIKIVKSKIVAHSWPFQNIAFKYFSEEAVIQKMYTKEQIEDMKKSELYMPYELVKDYFKVIKNHYDFCELTVIISCLYDTLLIYADVINILYTTIKNYYGKGKIELNRTDIEAFISQVKPKYDAHIIRKQFKTIKKLELVIKSILKVIDNDIIPILPQPHRTLFELKKNTTFKTLKELADDHLDFVGKDLEVLKTKYKSQNNNLYTFIMASIDAFEGFDNFYDIFLTIYMCKFDGINPNNNVNEYLKKIYKTDMKKLVQFTSANFPVDKICMEILTNTLSKSILYTISVQYHNNLALYRYLQVTS